jgi:ubiquinone biosynthesis protein COQ4
VTDHGSYVRSRYRKTHDIWHVVTGYSTSVVDELALQAFTFAQIHGPGSGLVLAIGLFHFVFFHPTQLPSVMQAIVEGYLRGKTAVALLGVDWSQLWNKPLAEVKQLLRTDFTPVIPTATRKPAHDAVMFPSGPPT